MTEGQVAADVDHFIRLFDEAPDETACANAPYIRRTSASLRLIEGGIEGPDVSDEIFANLHLRDLARELALDLLVPTGTYYRWTNDPDEPALARDRTLRASVNHRTGQQEIGLSVAEGPWFYGRGNSWCYFVSGQNIGRGSDCEPLLAVNGLNVKGRIAARSQLLTQFHARNKKRLSSIALETGMGVVELFALLIVGQ
jgi:hypothetical protein